MSRGTFIGSLPGCLVASLGMGPATAIEFDAGLLRQGSSLDLRRFEGEAVVPQGHFTLDVVLNQQWKGRLPVLLKSQSPGDQATPCYSEGLLERLGLDLQSLASDTLQRLKKDGGCLALSELQVPASETLDFGALRLDLVVAQQVISRQSDGHFPADQWDSGVSAGFIDYRFNRYQQNALQQGGRTRQEFLGLRMGLNTGDWYWRHEGRWQGGDTGASYYQAGGLSVRRDIPKWSSQVTLGDSYSRGDVFDASALRGVLLNNDERMLPHAQRGFSPVVSGVANSTALLSIRQRGVLVHESTVAPGPFEIDDLYASGLNDDLEVTLREADGDVRTFFVPSQAAPLALRPGSKRFEFGAGVWRDELGQTGPGHLQGSWQQGLNNHLSLHGGGWLATDYLASAMGVAINSGFGAVGLTGYHSRVSLDRDVAGQAWRISWRHRLAAWGTDVGATLMQSEGYYRFDDFAQANQGQSLVSARRRVGLTLNQPLGSQGGRLALTAGWGQGADNHNSYSLGYNNHLGKLNYGLRLSRERRPSGQALDRFTFTASLPLGERRRASLSSGMTVDSQGLGRSNVRWRTTAGEREQWGYGLAAVRQEGPRGGAGFDANLLHRGSFGELSASFADRHTHRQATLGAQGALVAHPGGLSLAPPLGESFAIVHAPGANAARLRQHPQIRLDERGFAVVPALLPYGLNTVELDPKGMSTDVELQLTGQSVVPRSGAASWLHYPTRSGHPLMLHALKEDGQALPFGALVLDEVGSERGMVGQGSRLHVRGDGQRGRLKVIWGEASDQQCWLDYSANPSGRLEASSCATVGPS